MPRKPKERTTIIKDTLPGEEEETGSMELVDEDLQDSEFQNLVAKIAGGSPVSFKVYRITSKGSDYCFASEDAGEFDEELIREYYPQGGKFMIRIYREGKYVQSVSTRIAPQPQTSVANGSNNGEIQVQMLREQLQWQQNITTTLLQNRPVAPTTPTQPPPTMAEMVQTIVALQGLNNGHTDNNSQAMEMILKGIEIAREVESGGDWKSQLISTFKDVAPAVIASLPAASSNGEPVTNTNTNPPPRPVPVAPSVEQETTQVIKYLKAKCIQGIPPDFFVDAVLINSDEPKYQYLLQQIATQTFEQFVTIDPEIGNEAYGTFFRSIYDGLRQELNRENIVVGNSSGTSGDKADVTSDEDVGDAGNPAA
jgi:hypothetical protein